MNEDKAKEKLDRLEAYEAAFWPQPRDLHVLLTLADSHLALTRFNEAAHLLELAIEREPESALAHYRLGQIFETTGRLAAAAEKFADAFHFDPDDRLDAFSDVERLAEGPLLGPQAVKVLRTIAAKYPKDLLFKYPLAVACNCENELSEAERFYREFLAYDFPNDEWRATIELHLSNVLWEIGKNAEAIALREKALPRLGTEWNREEIEDVLADDYLVVGRFEDALRIYLNWLGEAHPSVGLTRDAGAGHLWRDAQIYKKVTARILKILDSVQKQPQSDGDLFTYRGHTMVGELFGKLHLALSRCYEEAGEIKKSEQAYEKAMEYFGKSS